MEYTAAVKILQGQVDLQAEKLYQLASNQAEMSLIQSAYKKYYAQAAELYALFLESLSTGKDQGQFTLAEYKTWTAELQKKFLEQMALVAVTLDKVIAKT